MPGPVTCRRNWMNHNSRKSWHNRYGNAWFHWLIMTCGMFPGFVSLKFWELSKITSPKFTMPDITFVVLISSWNFVHVPIAWLRPLVQTFSWEFSLEARFLQWTDFEIIFWRTEETLVKHTPDSTPPISHYILYLRDMHRYDINIRILLRFCQQHIKISEQIIRWM